MYIFGLSYHQITEDGTISGYYRSHGFVVCGENSAVSRGELVEENFGFHTDKNDKGPL